MHLMCRVLFKKEHLQCVINAVSLHIRFTQIVTERYVIGQVTAKVRWLYVPSWNLGTSRWQLVELRCCRSATRATGIHSSRQIIRCLAVHALVHRLSVHTDTRKHVDSTAIGGWVGVYHLYQLDQTAISGMPVLWSCYCIAAGAVAWQHGKWEH